MGHVVHYTHGDVGLRGYIAKPLSPRRSPGILVLPEGFGLDANTKRRADMLAALGYVALAADLYGDGRTTDSSDEALTLMLTLTSDLALWQARVQAAFDAMCSDSSVDATAVAAIGYCFGGSSALEFARTGAALRAVVTFHSAVDTQLERDASRFRSRILMFTGAADSFIPLDHIQRFAQQLEDARVRFEIVIYGGVRHSFTNPQALDPSNAILGYDEHADHRSWNTMRELLVEAFGNCRRDLTP